MNRVFSYRILIILKVLSLLVISFLLVFGYFINSEISLTGRVVDNVVDSGSSSIFSIVGYVVSGTLDEKEEEIIERFEDEIVLEIKKPVELIGNVVSENKNERMDFKDSNGEFRLYFDLLDYDKFVEEVVDKVIEENFDGNIIIDEEIEVVEDEINEKEVSKIDGEADNEDEENFLIEDKETEPLEDIDGGVGDEIEGGVLDGRDVEIEVDEGEEEVGLVSEDSSFEGEELDDKLKVSEDNSGGSLGITGNVAKFLYIAGFVVEEKKIVSSSDIDLEVVKDKTEDLDEFEIKKGNF